MSETRQSKTFDPFEAWREVRDASMDSWAKTMVQAVNTEAYAQASGAMLDAYLTASIPLREMMEKVMSEVLQQANMPSRDDFMSMAERLIQIEMRLDDLDAKLDEYSRQKANEPAPRSAEAPPSKSRRKEAK